MSKRILSYIGNTGTAIDTLSTDELLIIHALSLYFGLSIEFINLVERVLRGRDIFNFNKAPVKEYNQLGTYNRE
jgi:hypothetical protein